MTGAPVTIDMMELADLGQPGKLALEIHRQLRLQFGSVPRRVPLEAVAKAIGIIAIKETDVDQFDGTIVIDGNVGAIALRMGMNPGRRNFTLGHEVGHFLIPTHRMLRSEFKCARGDVNSIHGSWSNMTPKDNLEVEASEFARIYFCRPRSTGKTTQTWKEQRCFATAYSCKTIRRFT